MIRNYLVSILNKFETISKHNLICFTNPTLPYMLVLWFFIGSPPTKEWQFLTWHPDQKLLSRVDQLLKNVGLFLPQEESRDLDERRFQQILFGGDDSVKFSVAVVVQNNEAYMNNCLKLSNHISLEHSFDCCLNHMRSIASYKFKLKKNT